MSEASELNDYKKVFDKNGSIKELRVLKWIHFENSVKSPLTCISREANGNIVAIYATMPVITKINGDTRVACQSLDTLTDSNHRGKGLFIKLAQKVYDKAKSQNVAFVYGFPNGKSIHGFSNKLEWEDLDQVTFLIKPLKTGYFTNRLKFLEFLPSFNLSFGSYTESEKYRVVMSNSFPIQVDEIWQNFSKKIKVAVDRNKEYLDWRFINKPNENYKIVQCYDKADDFIGFIVYCVKNKHKGRIAYIMEFIYDLNHPKSGKQLLDYAVQEIKKEKAELILTWCFEHSPNYKALKNNYFFKMPEKLRPIELHFGARAFDDNLKEIIAKRENWYLSYSDSDTV